MWTRQPRLSGETRQEGLHVWGAHLPRVTAAVKPEKAPDPADVGLLSARAEMPETTHFSNPVELQEPGRRRDGRVRHDAVAAAIPVPRRPAAPSAHTPGRCGRNSNAAPRSGWQKLRHEKGKGSRVPRRNAQRQQQQRHQTRECDHEGEGAGQAPASSVGRSATLASRCVCGSAASTSQPCAPDSTPTLNRTLALCPARRSSAEEP